MSVSAQLSVRRGREAVDFYKAAFGAVEVHRVGGTDEHKDVVLSSRLAPRLLGLRQSPPHKNFSPETWAEAPCACC